MSASPEKDSAGWQPGEVSKANTTRGKYNSRSTKTEAQIERLLEMLRTNPRHTHELRKAGISHPAGRVKDLIGRGYCIDSCRINTVDSDGFIHVRVALYELISEPMGGAA
jgi:hypothetical protein